MYNRLETTPYSSFHVNNLFIPKEVSELAGAIPFGYSGDEQRVSYVFEDEFTAGFVELSEQPVKKADTEPIIRTLAIDKSFI
jgi:hypothetical protein